MSIGVVATAIALIIGYFIVSRTVGLAFRLVINLVLLVILGGAGVFSGPIPERAPEEQSPSYGQAQHRPIGDLRLRDIAEVAADAARSVLQAGLALLDGVPEPAPRREPHWPDEPHHARPSEPYGAPPAFTDDARHGEPRRRC